MKQKYFYFLLIPFLLLTILLFNRPPTVYAHPCTPETPPDQKCFPTPPPPTATPAVTTAPTTTPYPTPTTPAQPTTTPTPAPTTTDTGGGGGVGGASAPGAFVCPDLTPTTPTLVSVSRTNPTTAMLSWNKVSNANNYSIVYGLTNRNYSFGVLQTGAVNTFSVGSLAANTNYCFAIRSLNGCQPSQLSNEICLTGQVLGTKRGEVLGVSTLAATGNFPQTLGNMAQGIGLLLIITGVIQSRRRITSHK